ncbi:MAG: hypothetical protein K2M42_06745 [Oscillospiraceae bacterium]|nr:hypothetical protein [Oscillospiraceae bacterium]
MDNAQKIWDKLIAAGLTPAGAAGLLGNLQAESGLNPQNLQNTYEKKLGFTDTTYTAAVDNGTYTNFAYDGAGYGLAQWTYIARKAALLAFARAQGASIGDLDMQVDFLLQELQSLFRAVWDKLRTTSSVREASDCVLLQFERPANQSAENCARRAAIAQEFYDKFTGGTSMNYIMNAAAFCAQALDIARNYKTSYMLGPWGWPATDKMITRATTNGSNAQTNKQWLAKANAIKGKGFLFDCVGLIKGILWGWSGDLSRTYGGAGYACNGVPDYDAKKMIDCCREVSTDFSRIVPGEAVWMDGHIGIYVGGGVVVESTPKWQGGVQCSTLTNTAGSQKLPGTVGSRTWTKHGKLPWVDYTAAKENNEEDDDMTEAQIRKIVRDEFAKIEAARAALPVAPWAEEELATAVARGITDGKRPQATPTRQEAAIMVLRGMQHKE